MVLPHLIKMHLLLQILLPLTILILFLIRKYAQNKPIRPPGPPGLPIIGNLPQFNTSSPHIYLHELSKTYGPLMSLRLGFRQTLVVSSAKMAKEVLKTHDQIFCSRPALVALQKLSYNGLDIALSPYGDYWREVRKICIVHLFSSKRVQSFSPIREDEAHQMIEKISSLSDDKGIVDLSEMLRVLTSNVICRVSFGRRYDGNTRCGVGFHQMLEGAEEMFTSFSFSDYFPFMGWLDKLIGASSRLSKISSEFDDFYEEIIDEHSKPSRPDSGLEDIVDVLLKLQEENPSWTKDHVKAILMDIFIAGTDTSSSTIVYAMTELIKNPVAMKRVQEEARAFMESNNGSLKLIGEQDMEKFMYLKAVVKETWRLHAVVPLLVPRETIQKCNLEGYQIQAKTLVYVNAWAIGRDPETWEDPEEFKPERFIKNKVIDFRGQHFELIPFGSGRRICPGMSMGVALVELALANLVCWFDWTLPAGLEKEVTDVSSLPGITVHKKYPLRLQAKSIC